MMAKGTGERRLFAAACGGILLLLVFSLPAIPRAGGETLGTWNSGSFWPSTLTSGAVGGESCVVYSGYIYCVGGFLAYPYGPQREAAYAPISSSGVGAWSATTSYPTGFWLGSCAADPTTGYIYCAGGYTDESGDIANAVYYATLSSSGIGAWQSTVNLPTALASLSCAISSGYIYCVGGDADSSYPYTPSNAVYYASVSSSGVGSWGTSTLPRVLDGESCAIYSGYIYCVGGEVTPGGTGPGSNVPAPWAGVYYASVSSSGVGTFTATTSYPTNAWLTDCAISSGYIYCMGGLTGQSGNADFTSAVKYAAVSSSGVGTWTNTTSYPETISEGSCVAYSGYIYCVGGVTGFYLGSTPYEFIIGNVYYASAGSSSTTSSTSSSSTSTFRLVCPSTGGGVLMPVGATFTDSYGNTWLAPSGNQGASAYWSSYFFVGPASFIPPPMLQGWAGVYGTYNGQQGWIITFFC